MRRPSLRASTLALTLVVLAAWLARLPRGEGAGALNLDVDLYFYPIWEATYARIAGGTLPLWNPYQLAGIPWLATLQGGFFYPLHALYLVLPLHVGLAASHAVHLPLAALATAAFARRVGLSPAAAWLAAVLFTLRGLFGLSLAAPNYIEAAAWIPLGALGVVDLAGDRSRRGVVVLAIATAASFLAGYPQPTVYGVYAWATLLAALLLGAGASPRRWVTVGAVFGAALALGALAAAIQLAPALELVADGAHRDLTPEAMSPLGLSFAGSVLAPQVIAGGQFSWGVTALALGAVALLGRSTRPLAWWAIVAAALSLILSLGDRTPLSQLYRALPMLDSFRFPDRLVGVTDFAFAVAAAIGLDAVAGRRDLPGPRDRRPAVAALVAIVALIVFAWSGGAPQTARAHVAAFALVAGSLVLLPLVTGRPNPGLVAGGLAALATAEVLLAPWQQVVTYSPRTVARYERFAPEYRAIAEQAGPSRVWFVGKGVLDLQPEHARKLATRYRYKTIDDYEPLAPRRQAEYFAYFGEGTIQYRRPPWLFAGGVDSFTPPPGIAPAYTRRRLIDLAAVRFVLLPAGSRRRLADVDAFLRNGGFVERPFVSPAFTLLENPDVLPRAFVVYRTRPAPEPASLLAAISRPSFDPLVESYVEGAAGFEPTPDAPRGAVARIVVDGEHAVELEATLERPGLVVLADAFYPGWRATIDGRPATVVATNHLFRGVAAPAGTHRVRYEYRPVSVAFGAAGSVLGWVAIALLARRKVDTAE